MPNTTATSTGGLSTPCSTHLSSSNGARNTASQQRNIPDDNHTAVPTSFPLALPNTAPFRYASTRNNDSIQQPNVPDDNHSEIDTLSPLALPNTAPFQYVPISPLVLPPTYFGRGGMKECSAWEDEIPDDTSWDGSSWDDSSVEDDGMWDDGSDDNGFFQDDSLWEGKSATKLGLSLLPDSPTDNSAPIVANVPETTHERKRPDAQSQTFQGYHTQSELSDIGSFLQKIEDSHVPQHSEKFLTTTNGMQMLSAKWILQHCQYVLDWLQSFSALDLNFDLPANFIDALPDLQQLLFHRFEKKFAHIYGDKTSLGFYFTCWIPITLLLLVGNGAVNIQLFLDCGSIDNDDCINFFLFQECCEILEKKYHGVYVHGYANVDKPEVKEVISKLLKRLETEAPKEYQQLKDLAEKLKVDVVTLILADGNVRAGSSQGLSSNKPLYRRGVQDHAKASKKLSSLKGSCLCRLFFSPETKGAVFERAAETGDIPRGEFDDLAVKVAFATKLHERSCLLSAKNLFCWVMAQHSSIGVPESHKVIDLVGYINNRKLRAEHPNAAKAVKLDIYHAETIVMLLNGRIGSANGSFGFEEFRGLSRASQKMKAWEAYNAGERDPATLALLENDHVYKTMKQAQEQAQKPIDFLSLENHTRPRLQDILREYKSKGVRGVILHDRVPKQELIQQIEQCRIVVPPDTKLGLHIASTDGGTAPFITEVNQDSVLAGKIKKGDLLLEVNGEDVRSKTATEVREMLSKLAACQKVLLVTSPFIPCDPFRKRLIQVLPFIEPSTPASPYC